MRRFAWLVALLALSCAERKAGQDSRPYTELNLLEPSTADAYEIERLLNEAFDEALSKTPKNASIDEKVKRINWWVHTHLYQVDPEPPNTYLKILEQRRGQCGSSSFVFQGLVKRLGLKTRSVGLFCIPRQNGHVGAEVWYEGAWHFFDPSFGVFFSSNAKVDGPVASYADIEAFPALVDGNLFYPVSRGRLGWNYPPMEEKRIDELYAKKQPAYEAAWGDYKLFLANSCGGTPYGAARRIELPYRLSLAAGQHHLGEIDGSSEDINLHGLANDKFYDATGQDVLGDDGSSLGALLIDHRYVITSLYPGAVVSVRLYRSARYSLQYARFRAFGAGIERIDYLGDDEVVVWLRARAETVELRSWSAGDRRIELDAVHFRTEDPALVEITALSR